MVSARPPFEGIITITAIHDIIATLTKHKVIAIAALKTVPATATRQRVIIAPAKQRVISIITEQLIIATHTIERIVAAAESTTATDGFTDGTGKDWKDSGFDDSSWKSGNSGVGYEANSDWVKSLPLKLKMVREPGAHNTI